MNIAGIDYSLTSPSICIFRGNEVWDKKKCKFYYMSKNKKFIEKTDLLEGYQYPEYRNDTERYCNLSEWTTKILLENDVTHAIIEGYAYNAVGRVFQIAENGGLLKTFLWKNGISYDVLAPTEVKKFGSGKGNANKEVMYDAFLLETGINLFAKINQDEKKHWNPVSDMVDSYYICKLGHKKLIDKLD